MTVSGVDSVEVRVHLYERSFPGKTCQSCSCSTEMHSGIARDTARLTRRCHGPSAVLPDDSDTHPGRERPPQIEARDRVRGVAEGVAHAPDVSRTAADGRARQRRGRHGAPPAAPRRSRSLAKTSTESILQATKFMPPRVSRASTRRKGGTAPESVFPPLPPLTSKIVQPRSGRRGCGNSPTFATMRAPASPAEAASSRAYRLRRST